MSHWKAYHAGKITLRKARQLQLLKRTNPKKYKAEEKRLGV